MLQISIARCQIEPEIHNFPTMYGKGEGVDVVKIGEIKVSIQKLGLKQGFFWTEIWIISLQLDHERRFKQVYSASCAAQQCVNAEGRFVLICFTI